MNRIKTSAPFPSSYLSYAALRTSYEYVCLGCKESFTANTGNALRCKECGVKHVKEMRRKNNYGRGERKYDGAKFNK